MQPFLHNTWIDTVGRLGEDALSHAEFARNCWHEPAGRFLSPFRLADNTRLITVRRITCRCNHAMRLKIPNNAQWWCVPSSSCFPLFLGPILSFYQPMRERDTISGVKGLSLSLSHSMVFVLHMHRQLCHPVECCTRWVHRGHAIGSVSRKTWGDVTPIPFDEISMSFNVSPGGWTEPQGICSTSEEKTARETSLSPL